MRDICDYNVNNKMLHCEIEDLNNPTICIKCES